MHTATALGATGVRVTAIAVPWPSIGVLLFGILLLYSVGFSPLEAAHNAAHDARHASGFPCH